LNRLRTARCTLCLNFAPLPTAGGGDRSEFSRKLPALGFFVTGGMFLGIGLRGWRARRKSMVAMDSQNPRSPEGMNPHDQSA